MSWFEDIFRNLSFLLDKIVYTLIDWIYRLFISLAQVNINQDIVEDFATRIYALLGIFMLFRLAFSLITYLINPDNMKEGKTGGGALVKNVFISILLMALVPTIFSEAFNLQKIILEKDIIGQIILGVPMTNEQTQNKDTTGQQMAFTIFSAFFTPEHEDCSVPFSNNQLTASCRSALGESVAKDYEMAYKDRKISELNSVINSKDDNDNYIFHYQSFVSTIAGGFVAWIIMIFCIDVSLRLVKLAFLQIIAPIPVISYIDPKGADGIFKKWYTTCFKTYADVFIRLLAIYFAIYIISLLTSGFFNGDAFFVGYGDEQRALTGIETVFVILGVLMFAKQLPDLLKDLLGIDLKGNFTLNPMKKIEDSALGGKYIARAARTSMALAPAALATGGANFASRLAQGKGVGTALRSALGGMVGAGRRAIGVGLSGKNIRETYSQSYSGAVEARNKRDEWEEEGSTLGGRIGARARAAVHYKQKSEKTQAEIDARNEVYNAYDSMWKRAKEEGIKKDENYKYYKAKLDTLKSRSFNPDNVINKDDYYDVQGNFYSNEYNEAVRAAESKWNEEHIKELNATEQMMFDAQKEAAAKWINANDNDYSVQNAKAKRAQYASDYNLEVPELNGHITKAISGDMDELRNNIAKLENDSEFRAQKANASVVNNNNSGKK